MLGKLDFSPLKSCNRKEEKKKLKKARILTTNIFQTPIRVEKQPKETQSICHKH